MAAMFSLDQTTGFVREARIIESPNSDAWPEDSAPSLIVVHGISLPPGEFGGPWIDLLFTNKLPADAHPYFAGIADARVSAHFLIRRDGELVQYVPVGKRAWHAGESCYAGRTRCNDFAIGIELEGEDSTPYEDVQYDVLVALLVTLRSQVESLAEAEIVGHSDIAPGRKTDPGVAFDWPGLRARLSVA